MTLHTPPPDDYTVRLPLTTPRLALLVGSSSGTRCSPNRSPFQVLRTTKIYLRKSTWRNRFKMPRSCTQKSLDKTQKHGLSRTRACPEEGGRGGGGARVLRPLLESNSSELRRDRYGFHAPPEATAAKRMGRRLLIDKSSKALTANPAATAMPWCLSRAISISPLRTCGAMMGTTAPTPDIILSGPGLAKHLLSLRQATAVTAFKRRHTDRAGARDRTFYPPAPKPQAPVLA